MSNEKKTKSFNDLSQLSNLFSKDELDEKKFIPVVLVPLENKIPSYVP